MNVFRTPDEMRAWSRQQRCAGKRIGFVPTMGDLHEGHLSLMRAAVANDDVAVLSIYVNPAQFAPHEDFASYPRGWERDSGLARDCGIDAIYAPMDLYPEPYSTYVTAEGVSDGLCSNTRPHFFRGVATVVLKLFNAVLPDRAYFGEKDAQQCAVVTRMARDLDTGVEIVTLPTVREADGLAMSSRNRYLSEADRERALCISRALFAARDRMAQGEKDASTLTALVRGGMNGVEIDYVELVDAESIQPVARVDRPIVLAVAAKVGAARLIDNIRFVPETTSSS